MLASAHYHISSVQLLESLITTSWQFLAGLAFLSKHTSFATTMKAAFEACDVNGDGMLSRDEVESSLLNIFPELAPVTVLTFILSRSFDANASTIQFLNRTYINILETLTRLFACRY